MRGSPVLVLVTLGLIAALVGSVLFWIQLLNRNQAPQPVQNGVIETQEQQEHIAACEELQEIPYNISCEEAVRIVKEKHPGEVQDVEALLNVLPQTDVSMWSVMMRLEEPLLIQGRPYDAIAFFVDGETGAFVENTF